jgi:hypothetical protein
MYSAVARSISTARNIFVFACFKQILEIRNKYTISENKKILLGNVPM